MMIIDYRKCVLMTTHAANPTDPAGPGGISDCKPDDKIRLVIGSEDVMHCAQFSGRPVGVRRRPIL
jgi:hypothetical protein